VVELAHLFEDLPQLVVVAQPAAHLLDLFAAKAELAGAASGIGDSQNRQPMSAAAGARCYIKGLHSVFLRRKVAS
jgi:hypothetical protein